VGVLDVCFYVGIVGFVVEVGEILHRIVSWFKIYISMVSN
jgi:hypothetical protein